MNIYKSKLIKNVLAQIKENPSEWRYVTTRTSGQGDREEFAHKSVPMGEPRIGNNTTGVRIGFGFFWLTLNIDNKIVRYWAPIKIIKLKQFLCRWEKAEVRRELKKKLESLNTKVDEYCGTKKPDRVSYVTKEKE